MYLSETETSFADPVELKAVSLVNDMMNVYGTCTGSLTLPLGMIETQVWQKQAQRTCRP